nr:reverse transcriptase domain-containing protein [Tanacetum cinerariifolium]
MSSDNAQSAVTYTSISSYSDGPSWGIPLTNASEFSEMDPYEEVSQQGHVHPLSPAYVPYPMELDEHVPVYVPEPQHPEYHAPSDDDIQVEDDDEEPEEDPSEEHEPEDDNEDPEEDPNEEHELEDSDETEPFEKNEIAVTPSPPRHRGAKISVRPQTPMAASTKALIDAFASGSSPFPLPPTSPAYDQAHLGHRASMIRRTDDILKEDMPPWRRFTLTGPPPGCDVAESSAAAARAPRSQYNFVDTVEAGHGLIRSPGHYTWTIARDADRAEDVGYVRALKASEHMIMTSIEEVNLRVSYQTQVRRQESANFYTQLLDAQTDRRDIRLEIDVRQSAEDLAVTQLMRIHTLEARARADTVEDADRTNDVMTPESIQAMIDRAIQRNSTHTQDDASKVRGTLKKKLMDKYYPKGEIKKLEIELWNLKVKGNDVAAYTQRFQEQALMCTKFLTDETKKVDKYISGLPDNIHGNVMSARLKTLYETIELANDLMDQKLRTYAERQNENKRKANDSPRNNQQQPHKKQNVARAYTAGPGEKKVYTGDLPLCTKCNYHHTGQCA